MLAITPNILTKRSPGVMDWISVKDRLPENQIPVLAYSADDGAFVGQLIHWSPTHIDWWWATNVEEGYEAPENVTHWMPLPPPPIRGRSHSDKPTTPPT